MKHIPTEIESYRNAEFNNAEFSVDELVNIAADNTLRRFVVELHAGRLDFRYVGVQGILVNKVKLMFSKRTDVKPDGSSKLTLSSVVKYKDPSCVSTRERLVMTLDNKSAAENRLKNTKCAYRVIGNLILCEEEAYLFNCKDANKSPRGTRTPNVTKHMINFNQGD